VLRRFLLRSLILAGILLVCFAHLIWNGWHARKIVAENLPHPPLSSGKRDIDLWHPTASFGHVYDLAFTWPEEKPWNVPEGSRLQVQLASNGRTRLLVVRNGHPNDSVSWWDILRGRERLQIVADREWVDISAFPASGTQLDVQIYGLLPGPFGFGEQNRPGTEHFSGFRIRRPDSPLARPSRTIVRYRFLLQEPVPAHETLARFFFFISCSRVLQVTGVVAIGLLFAGWWWLWEKRHARAVACLVPAVTLLHACCLAPFQGADGATHTGTVEAVVWNPAMFEKPYTYPSSLGLLYQAIGYDAWVRYPEIPVPIDSPERRARVREIAGRRLEAEAKGGPALPEAFLINPRIRAPLYYNSFRILAPLLRKMGVLDRIEAFVVLSASASLLLFGVGLVVLARAGVDEQPVILYGLVAMVPYSVGVVASCSNYSVAIGIGQFLAACLIVGALVDSPRQRLLASALFTASSLIGIGIWDDFVFFAVPSAVVLTLLVAYAAYQMPVGSGRRLAAGAMAFLGILLIGTIAFALRTGWIRQAISSFGARVPQLGGFEDPSLWLLLAAAAVPIVASLVLALAIVSSLGMLQVGRRRAAWARSAAFVILFAAMFFLTPWSAVPFETVRLDYPDEVAAHWSAFWSNNFAFDQDVLSWKMYWGVFGYADVSYPDAIYALARWACVMVFLSLPVLSWRFTQRRPGRSALLLVASGYALSACIVTNSLRYFAPTNPWGRFLLPALPLFVLPLITRAFASERVPDLRPTIAAFAALHVWTAIALLGSRYALGI
jgi:hypothetical protein